MTDDVHYEPKSIILLEMDLNKNKEVVIVEMCLPSNYSRAKTPSNVAGCWYNSIYIFSSPNPGRFHRFWLYIFFPPCDRNSKCPEATMAASAEESSDARSPCVGLCWASQSLDRLTTVQVRTANWVQSRF